MRCKSFIPTFSSIEFRVANHKPNCRPAVQYPPSQAHHAHQQTTNASVRTVISSIISLRVLRRLARNQISRVRSPHPSINTCDLILPLEMFDLSRDLCSANGISVTITLPTSNVGGNHGTTSTHTPTTPTTPGTTFRATTPTPTATRTSSSSSTSTAGAAKMAGPGFVVAAAMGAALFAF